MNRKHDPRGRLARLPDGRARERGHAECSHEISGESSRVILM